MNYEYESSSYLIKRIIRDFVSKYYGKLALAIICMIFVAATTALHAWIMKPILDQVFSNKDKQLLMILPIALFAISILRGLAGYFQNLLTRYVESAILIDVQLQLFDKLVVSDFSFLKNTTTGALISHFTNDVNIMRQSISSVLTSIVREFLSLIFLLALIFYYLPKLALIVFATIPLAAFPLYYLGKKMRKISHNTQAQMADVTKQFEETFRGIRVVKAYNAEEYEQRNLRNITSSLLKILKKGIRADSLSSPLMEMLGGMSLAIIIGYGGAQVISGEITQGTFFLFVTSLLSLYRPMKSLSKLNTILQSGLAAANRVFKILDQETFIKDNISSSKKVQKGEVEFKQVSFSYEAQQKAIADFSLKIKKGELIALVGPSGSGKSTIMNLLLRFYDVSTGSIKIDGEDIKDYSLKNLRRAISYVSQEIFLFDDTVRANLTYGLEREVTDEEIIAAAKKAQADEFIKSLPNAYDSKIGQAGNRLSGGQKQRLVIARAILRDAPIVLLDEATSALDPVSERQIRMAFDDLLKSKTAIVVAHRLQTIEHADRIFFMQQGKIIASGSNEELLEKVPEYRKFYYGELS